MSDGAVGVVGLGAMGLPIVSTLVSAGLDVVGHDLDGVARRRAVEGGVNVVEFVELTRRASVLILSLPTPAAVSAVIDQIVVEGARDLTVLDTSTVDPGTAQAAATRLHAQDCDYADCPVLGRPVAVGNWTFPVGGSEDVFETAQRTLAPLAKQVLHVGEVGTAATVKILNNMMLGVINAATAEVLVLAEASGLDPGVFVDTILDSGAASVSGLFREVAPRAVKGDFDPTFSVRLMHKDNALAMRLGERHGIPLLVASSAQSLTTMAMASGYGDEDSVAVLRVIEAVTGITARRH